MRRSIHTSFKERPYGLLLFTAIALSLVLVFLSMTYLDFQNKTMFRIPLGIMVWIIPLILICFWLLYLVTKKFLFSITITWTHVLLTVSSTILAVIILGIVFMPVQPGYASSDRQELIGNATRIVFTLFVFGQCIYLVNVLLGLFSKAKYHPE